METYKDNSCTNCHKDFCDCVKNSIKEFKKQSRDRKVNAAINFLNKSKISFSTTGVENIVRTDYWGDTFYISLKSFKLRKEGSNVWVEKKKKLIKPTSKLEFGKYKGLTFQEVLEKHKEYLIWVNENTDILLNRDSYDLIK